MTDAKKKELQACMVKHCYFRKYLGSCVHPDRSKVVHCTIEGRPDCPALKELLSILEGGDKNDG